MLNCIMVSGGGFEGGGGLIRSAICYYFKLFFKVKERSHAYM